MGRENMDHTQEAQQRWGVDLKNAEQTMGAMVRLMNSGKTDEAGELSNYWRDANESEQVEK